MKKKIILCICLITSLCLIVTGIILYRSNYDKTSGIFVRKTYGSIGNLDNANVTLYYELYNFKDKNVDFLTDTEHLSFDTELVNVEQTRLTLNQRINDLQIYSFEIDVSFSSYGSICITELIFSNEEIISINLGNLIIVNLNNTRTSINHSIDTLFFENKGRISFSRNNSLNFLFNRFIYDSPNILKLNYSRDMEYIAGHDLALEYDIEFICSKFDLVVFLPIVEISLNGVVSYFTPLSYTSNYEDMTYIDIREYVNDKA